MASDYTSRYEMHIVTVLVCSVVLDEVMGNEKNLIYAPTCGHRKDITSVSVFVF